MKEDLGKEQLTWGKTELLFEENQSYANKGEDGGVIEDTNGANQPQAGGKGNRK